MAIRSRTWKKWFWWYWNNRSW